MMKLLKTILQTIIIISLSFYMSSCLSKEGAQSELEKSYLPSAKGKAGEMVLVIDTVQWKPSDGVGAVLYENVLGKTRGVLPQPEPQFTVTQVAPSGFTSILRQARNVLIVTTFDQNTHESAILRSYFGKGVIEKLRKEGEKKYYFVKKDAWANGQTVELLFAKDEATLKKILEDPKKARVITEHFHEVENEILQKSIRKSYSKNTDSFLRREWKVSMKLFDGYKIAQNDKDFLWLRHPELSFDNNIFIIKVPYTDQKQFDPKEIIAFRDKIAKQYLYGDPSNQNSFVLTEPLVPVEANNTKIDGHLAVEVRGLWKTNNISMGGPFVSYTFTDKSGAYLYYIEGFIFAPGMNKRDLVREMEAQLRTFKEID